MNILITGGSRGIGREAAIALSADRNNHIVITGRNEKALLNTQSASLNNNIEYYVVDFLEHEKSFAALMEHISFSFSIIDVLINNAGNLINKRFNDLNYSDMRVMMEINYFAPAALIKALFNMMRKGSHIINISSMGGYQGSSKFSGLSGYSASKAAIACLSECLAAEYSEYGISVNCLALGSASTEMLNEAFPGYKAPVSAKEMGNFIAWFAREGGKIFNGKVLPVALRTP